MTDFSKLLKQAKDSSTPEQTQAKQASSELRKALSATPDQTTESQQQKIGSLPFSVAQPDETKTPEDLIKEFQGKVMLIEENLTDREMVKNGITNIITMLRKHKFLEENVGPEELRVIVKGIRENYGQVLQKKEKASSKRADTKKDKQEAAQLLDSLGFLS